jgi:hypothetical protein
VVSHAVSVVAVLLLVLVKTEYSDSSSLFASSKLGVLLLVVVETDSNDASSLFTSSIHSAFQLK